MSKRWTLVISPDPQHTEEALQLQGDVRYVAYGAALAGLPVERLIVIGPSNPTDMAWVEKVAKQRLLRDGKFYYL
jgi:hypothetical protein